MDSVSFSEYRFALLARGVVCLPYAKWRRTIAAGVSVEG